jgi:hypothetical protein
MTAPSHPTAARCPHCGALIRGADLTCSLCGAAVQSRPAPPAPPIARVSTSARPAGTAPGGDTGEEFVNQTVRGVRIWVLVESVVGLAITSTVLLLVSAGAVFLVVFARVPAAIALIFPGVLALIVLLQALTLRKMAGVNVDPAARPAHAPGRYAPEADERLVLWVAPVSSEEWRQEVLGVAQLRHPHNALLLTNRRLLLIVLPVAGAGQVLGDVDFGFAELVLAKKQMRAKLEEMLAMMSLEQILHADATNVALRWEEIRQIRKPWAFGPIQSLHIAFVTTRGEKYGYMLADVEDMKRLRGALGW